MAGWLDRCPRLLWSLDRLLLLSSQLGLVVDVIDLRRYSLAGGRLSRSWLRGARWIRGLQGGGQQYQAANECRTREQCSRGLADRDGTSMEKIRDSHGSSSRPAEGPRRPALPAVTSVLGRGRWVRGDTRSGRSATGPSIVLERIIVLLGNIVKDGTSPTTKRRRPAEIPQLPRNNAKTGKLCGSKRL